MRINPWNHPRPFANCNSGITGLVSNLPTAPGPNGVTITIKLDCSLPITPKMVSHYFDMMLAEMASTVKQMKYSQPSIKIQGNQ